MKIIIISSIFTVFTILNSQTCESYRILGLFPLDMQSHFVMFEPLLKALARRGHQVDVISTFPLKKPYPNYTDIIKMPHAHPQLLNNLTYENVISFTSNTIDIIALMMGNKVCEQLGHPEMLKLIRNPPNDPPYDLVITEFYCTNCFLAVGHHLKIPSIGISTALLYPWLHSVIANPPNYAFVPNNLLNYGSPMNFWARFWNTVYSIYHDLYFRYLTRPQDDIIRKYFGEDAPGVREVEKNLALVLINSHPSLNGAKPMTTALIEVGGLHVEDNDTEMSEDLKDWMDRSKEGFVYFTFGSMITIESFPKEFIQVLYKSLGKIAPIRVLLKIPNPKALPPGLPTNIRTFKWAPQYKVFKHKNIKAFITHGGLMGTQEAVHCGVPMIGIPFVLDQFINVDHYVKKKVAIKLDFKNLTEKNMDNALNEILYNPIYRNSMTKFSKLFRDRPMSPMDTAVWWVEYIARHGNSKVLRSHAMDLAWWQIELFDLYLFLLFIVAITIFLAIVLVRLFINVFVTKTGPNVTSSKKSQ